MTTVRIGFRLYRFQVIALALLAVCFTAAAFYLAADLRSVSVPAACFGSQPPDDLDCHAMVVFMDRSMPGENLLMVAMLAPFMVGLFLGAPAGSAEIEDGSALLTWSLDRRTGRWMAERLVFLLAVGLLVMVPIAASSQVLAAAVRPTLPMDSSFALFASRGLPLLARFVATFAVCSFIGVAVGRVLPAILVGSLASAALFVALVIGLPLLVSPVAVAQDRVNNSYLVTANVYGRDGVYYTQAEVDAASPFPTGSAEYWRWLSDSYQPAAMAIPPSAYPDAVIREGAGLGALGVVSLVGTLVVVRRRRPA